MIANFFRKYFFHRITGFIQKRFINNNKSYFDKLLTDILSSEGHKILCSRVYGINLNQLNMVTFDQMNHLLQVLQIREGDEILDIGCGLGGLVKFISKKYNCKCFGSDFINLSKINLYKKTKFPCYVQTNINENCFKNNSFKYVVSLDSLYFCKNMTNTISTIKKMLKSNGRVGIFYSQTASCENDIELHFDYTRIANALKRNNMNYKVVDYTHDEIKLWEDMIRILKENRKLFKEENKLRLYKIRFREAMFMYKYASTKRLRRYLYYT